LFETERFRFPGQYLDDATGLHYNYHRYYHPGIGRYLNVDPIGLVGGLNLFIYSGDRPVSAVDPIGLAWIQKSYGIQGTGGLGFWKFVAPSIFLHAEGNVGVLIDTSDILNSKLYLHGQVATMVGAGIVLQGGVQSGLGVSKNEPINGKTLHIEGGGGWEIFSGGSIDIGLKKCGDKWYEWEYDPSVAGAIGHSRRGIGWGLYGGVGVANNGYLKSPSARDAINWVKNNEAINTTISWMKNLFD
jgi:RHS repeat-associated protein